jgi:dephospho-CoA kinase
MQLLGLTGGIGMGKSVVGSVFSELNIPIIDTDIIARRIVETDSEICREMARRFGASIFNEDGTLDRQALGRVVFADKAKLRVLESILHPPIRRHWKKEVELWQLKGEAFGLVIIPLLYETKAEASFDYVICVASDKIIQESRLKGRNWGLVEIAQRISSQMDVQEKITRADFVIWNDSSIEVLRRQVNLILASIEKSRLKIQ